MALHRTQILLEPDQHRALIEISRREGRSVSDLIREIVRAELEHRTVDAAARKARQDALMAELRAQWDRVMAERQGRPAPIDTVELIHEMWDDRDDAVLGRADQSN